MRGKIVKIEPISQKFHDVFRFTRRTAEVSLTDGIRHKFVRHVLETGPAVSILPYFYDKEKKEWFVVFIRQHRPAVDSLCLEAPGGLTKKGRKIKHEMARELFEEAGVVVKPSSILIVGKQHHAPSFCDQVVHLGIVDLKIDSAKALSHLHDKNHGLVNEREFTEIVILPLSKALSSQNLITYTLARYQIYDLARRLKYHPKHNSQLLTHLN